MLAHSNKVVFKNYFYVLSVCGCLCLHLSPGALRERGDLLELESFVSHFDVASWGSKRGPSVSAIGALNHGALSPVPIKLSSDRNNILK